MKLKILLFLLIFSSISFEIFSGDYKKPIDVVICMDLSGSTNGLLDDVRDMLWDMINQVNTFHPQPNFRVGIVAFSRPTFGRSSGFVKILSPLSNNYSPLAYELAKLTLAIEKGDQLVGAALRASVTEMKWSADEQAIKVIFLIGNGRVSLDKFRYREAYELAAKRKIIVNTIYCMTSNFKEEILGWKEIADATGGVQYDVIVHKRNPLILTGKDSLRLVELHKKLWATYIHFGKTGKDYFNMEEMIDRTAMLANEMTFQSRLFYKISDFYQLKQQHWDLVDYIKITNGDLRKIDPALLPKQYKSYTADALRVLVANKKHERAKIINSMREFLPYDRQK
ncbi:MAG TPA: VWA domain-containing protein, partial [Bacteroidia bacterium]|nr:VWA domain-containing protein [Bacteroidia bacterium]